MKKRIYLQCEGSIIFALHFFCFTPNVSSFQVLLMGLVKTYSRGKKER